MSNKPNDAPPPIDGVEGQPQDNSNVGLLQDDTSLQSFLEVNGSEIDQALELNDDLFADEQICNNGYRAYWEYILQQLSEPTRQYLLSNQALLAHMESKAQAKYEIILENHKDYCEKDFNAAKERVENEMVLDESELEKEGLFHEGAEEKLRAYLLRKIRDLEVELRPKMYKRLEEEVIEPLLNERIPEYIEKHKGVCEKTYEEGKSRIENEMVLDESELENEGLFHEGAEEKLRARLLKKIRDVLIEMPPKIREKLEEKVIEPLLKQRIPDYIERHKGVCEKTYEEGKSRIENEMVLDESELEKEGLFHEGAEEKLRARLLKKIRDVLIEMPPKIREKLEEKVIEPLLKQRIPEYIEKHKGVCEKTYEEGKSKIENKMVLDESELENEGLFHEGAEEKLRARLLRKIRDVLIEMPPKIREKLEEKVIEPLLKQRIPEYIEKHKGVCEKTYEEGKSRIENKMVLDESELENEGLFHEGAEEKLRARLLKKIRDVLIEMPPKIREKLEEKVIEPLLNERIPEYIEKHKGVCEKTYEEGKSRIENKMVLDESELENEGLFHEGAEEKLRARLLRKIRDVLIEMPPKIREKLEEKVMEPLLKQRIPEYIEKHKGVCEKTYEEGKARVKSEMVLESHELEDDSLFEQGESAIRSLLLRKIRDLMIELPPKIKQKLEENVIEPLLADRIAEYMNIYLERKKQKEDEKEDEKDDEPTEPDKDKEQDKEQGEDTGEDSGEDASEDGQEEAPAETENDSADKNEAAASDTSSESDQGTESSDSSQSDSAQAVGEDGGGNDASDSAEAGTSQESAGESSGSSTSSLSESSDSAEKATTKSSPEGNKENKEKQEKKVAKAKEKDKKNKTESKDIKETKDGLKLGELLGIKQLLLKSKSYFKPFLLQWEKSLDSAKFRKAAYEITTNAKTADTFLQWLLADQHAALLMKQYPGEWQKFRDGLKLFGYADKEQEKQEETQNDRQVQHESLKEVEPAQSKVDEDAVDSSEKDDEGYEDLHETGNSKAETIDISTNGLHLNKQGSDDPVEEFEVYTETDEVNEEVPAPSSEELEEDELESVDPVADVEAESQLDDDFIETSNQTEIDEEDEEDKEDEIEEPTAQYQEFLGESLADVTEEPQLADDDIESIYLTEVDEEDLEDDEDDPIDQYQEFLGDSSADATTESQPADDFIETSNLTEVNEEGEEDKEDEIEEPTDQYREFLGGPLVYARAISQLVNDYLKSIIQTEVDEEDVEEEADEQTDPDKNFLDESFESIMSEDDELEAEDMDIENMIVELEQTEDIVMQVEAQEDSLWEMIDDAVLMMEDSELRDEYAEELENLDPLFRDLAEHEMGLPQDIEGLHEEQENQEECNAQNLRRLMLLLVMLSREREDTPNHAQYRPQNVPIQSLIEQLLEAYDQQLERKILAILRHYPQFRFLLLLMLRKLYLESQNAQYIRLMALIYQEHFGIKVMLLQELIDMLKRFLCFIGINTKCEQCIHKSLHEYSILNAAEVFSALSSRIELFQNDLHRLQFVSGLSHCRFDHMSDKASAILHMNMEGSHICGKGIGHCRLIASSEKSLEAA